MPGRKRKRNVSSFYTFAHPEALASLREYFDRERGWPKRGESVWRYETMIHKGKPVTRDGFSAAWFRLLKRAGHIQDVPTHDLDSSIRYGFGAHNTRDLAISHLTEVPNLKEMVVEYWAGHEIDPLGYRDLKKKPQFVEEQYRLALPYLALLSGPVEQQASDREAIKKLEERLARLEEREKAGRTELIESIRTR